MELRYQAMIYVGILCSAIFLVLYIMFGKGNQKFDGGVRLSDIRLLEQVPRYRRKKVLYRIFSTIVVGSLIACIIASAVLISRPYRSQRVSEEMYCRDILLCMDISTSVDELNMKLVDELKDTVRELKGERVGIIIFNTSPVLLSPLTDDYDYIIEQLDIVENALKERIKYDTVFSYYGSDDFYYLNEYISAGTLVGNEERGSSLIGDGLASCVNNFGTDTSEDRPRIVIFTTDNDPYGEELISLPDAAALCAKYGITVYGVGTEAMTPFAMSEMKTAVESTGGKFYLEEDSGSLHRIVESIEELSAGKVEGNSYIKETDQPIVPFICLAVAAALLFVTEKILRK